MKAYRKPATVKDLRENGRITLALGEVTGHHHSIYADTDTDTLADAEYFEEPDGRRVLLASKPCILRHQEHGCISVVPDDAARGALGERDAKGRLIGQYRQGDVLLHPIGCGVWEHRRQREYTPEAVRYVVD